MVQAAGLQIFKALNIQPDNFPFYKETLYFKRASDLVLRPLFYCTKLERWQEFYTLFWTVTRIHSYIFAFKLRIQATQEHFFACFKLVYLPFEMNADQMLPCLPVMSAPPPPTGHCTETFQHIVW